MSRPPRNTAVRVTKKRDGSGWTFAFLTQEGQDRWEEQDEDDRETALAILDDFADGLLPGQVELTHMVLA